MSSTASSQPLRSLWTWSAGPRRGAGASGADGAGNLVEVCSSWQSGSEKKVGHGEENLDDLDNGLELSKAA